MTAEEELCSRHLQRPLRQAWLHRWTPGNTEPAPPRLMGLLSGTRILPTPETGNRPWAYRTGAPEPRSVCRSPGSASAWQGWYREQRGHLRLSRAPSGGSVCLRALSIPLSSSCPHNTSGSGIVLFNSSLFPAFPTQVEALLGHGVYSPPSVAFRLVLCQAQSEGSSSRLNGSLSEALPGEVNRRAPRTYPRGCGNAGPRLLSRQFLQVVSAAGCLPG